MFSVRRWKISWTSANDNSARKPYWCSSIKRSYVFNQCMIDHSFIAMFVGKIEWAVHSSLTSSLFIHLQLKPDNFLMGTGKQANILHLIDFGLCKYFRDPLTHRHIPFGDKKSLTGTARYASKPSRCRVHSHCRSSRYSYASRFRTSPSRRFGIDRLRVDLSVSWRITVDGHQSEWETEEIRINRSEKTEHHRRGIIPQSTERILSDVRARSFVELRWKARLQLPASTDPIDLCQTSLSIWLHLRLVSRRQTNEEDLRTRSVTSLTRCNNRPTRLVE